MVRFSLSLARGIEKFHHARHKKCFSIVKLRVRDAKDFPIYRISLRTCGGCVRCSLSHTRSRARLKLKPIVREKCFSTHTHSLHVFFTQNEQTKIVPRLNLYIYMHEARERVCSIGDINVVKLLSASAPLYKCPTRGGHTHTIHRIVV
jgi:hypothetical protein